ncbi:MAG: hypothetical protein GYB67_10620 [Chloroflexi bacterium]|nr:hypothetical protein [Chloroflexota bacterium]
MLTKKRLLLFVLLLALTTGGLTATATPIDNLTTLADHFPEETVMFLSVRTDDGYIGALDELLNRLSQTAPDLIPPVGLDFLLDAAAFELTGEGFATGIRPWLGDSLAVGLTSADFMTAPTEFPGFLLAVEIDDRGAAEAFVEDLLAQGPAFGAPTTTGDFTIYPIGDPLALALSDEVLLIGLSEDLPLSASADTLADNADFGAVFGALPNDSYNVALYINQTELQQANTELLREQGLSNPFLELSQDLIGAQALGFTILGGDSLTIDAVTIFNFDAYEDIGIPLNFDLPAASLDFAANIPANASFVLQATDFGPSTQTGIEAFHAFADLITESGGLGSALGFDAIDPFAARELNAFDLGVLLDGLNIGFAGLTGLNLEREFLPLFTGDYALFMQLLPDADLQVLPSLGIVSETSDPVAASGVFNQLVNALDAYSSDVAIGNIGDAKTAVLPWLTDIFETVEFLRVPSLDLMLATDLDRFAFGTRDAITAIFDRAEMLADDADFSAASQHFLAGTQQIGYVGMDPIIDLLDELAATSLSARQAEDLAEAAAVLDLIESASFTGITNADVSVVRAVLTLNLVEAE